MERCGEPRVLFPRETDGSPSRDGSASRDSSPEADDYRQICSCKSTCQRRTCPCKEAGLHCGGNCKCGTKRNRCKNQPLAEDTSRLPTAQMPTSSRRSREEELLAFTSTLTHEQCCNLIMAAYSNHGGLQLAKTILDNPDPDPSPDHQQLGWCKCGKCRAMDQPIENLCCKQRPCITTTEFFESVVLDNNVLSVAIVNRCDTFADDPDYSPQSYRKAAYRQWIMWQHGYLGRSNRKVIPSCVVWAVRTRYPAPDGRYLGFKEY